MKLSKNKQISKNKFYNVAKGKDENGYFFFFPTISVSPKKLLSWDLSLYSIFIGVGKYFIQFNICETIKDTNTEVFKETMGLLIKILKSNGLKIKDMNAVLEFLNKNQHIVLILKNSNLSHAYVKIIIGSFFNNQAFVENIA